MSADLVLYNGSVHTMDPAVPRAQAVAIRGERVLAAGSDPEIRGLLEAGGKEVDLQGRTVVPGFIDAHLHFMSYARSFGQIDLDEAPSLEEALARVAVKVGTTPADRPVVGRGWAQSLWEGDTFPARRHLDRVAPDHAVFLTHKCGHAWWLNSRALERIGVTRETEDPPGGEIERDPATGEPTGILKEAAGRAASAFLGGPSVDEAVEAIREAMPRAFRAGLVGIHNMEGATALRAFQQLRVNGELKLRVLHQIPGSGLDSAVELGLQSGFGDAHLRIGGVKIFADGALGSRTAHMLEPFEGDPNNRGIAVLTPEELRDLIGKANRSGLAAFVHAIGDRANRDVLDAMQAARETGIGLPLRHRIEHAQILHPDDMPRLSALGVVASAQPIHATQDMRMVDRHWGKRGAGAYAWRSLLDNGAVLAFGSDAPVEDFSVVKGIHAAVTRRRPDGDPGPDGWYAEQRLTVGEAVHAYTMGAAYAAGEEKIKGSLSQGKLADLVILSQDIFAIDPQTIPETEVLATIIDGQWVYAGIEVGPRGSDP